MRQIKVGLISGAVALAFALLASGTASAAVQMYMYFPGTKPGPLAGAFTEWTVKRMDGKAKGGTHSCVGPVEPPWKDIVSEPEEFKKYAFEFTNPTTTCATDTGDHFSLSAGTLSITSNGKGQARMAGVHFEFTKLEGGATCKYVAKVLKGKFAVGASEKPVAFEPVFTGIEKLEGKTAGCEKKYAIEVAFEVTHEGQGLLDELAPPKMKK